MRDPHPPLALALLALFAPSALLIAVYAIGIIREAVR